MSVKHARSIAIVFVALVSACGGAAGGSSAPSSGVSGTPTTTDAGSTPGAPSPSSGGGSGSGSHKATVDLTFSGARAFTAKGEMGMCGLITKSDGTKELTVNLSADDQPEIGQGFSLTNAFNLVDLKWVPDETGGYGRPMSGGTWTIDANVTTFTVDGDLSVFKPEGGAGPGEPEHLKGTVTCP